MSAIPTLVTAKTPPSIMSLLSASHQECTRRLPVQRLLLVLVLLLAAFLSVFQLDQEGWGNDYYAAAVRSMLQSWHNFFFVSLDPGGFVSIDKPPLGFWIETASAKLFGYKGISLIAPQALAAVLAVAVLYHLVSRAFGFPAGLFAALALAVTPISVVGARSNNIDSQLVLMVLLTAWAVLKAAETGRLRWLLLGAVLLGLGFNIKTMQAYLVLPACALVYALGAPRSVAIRLAHLAMAAGVLLAVSFSWITAVDLTPASARPYVGSSCTNSELNLALGYNGLARLTGGLFTTCTASETATQRATTTDTQTAGAAIGAPARAGQGGGPGGGGPGGVGANGAAGPFRLLNQQLGGQIGWLLPLAVLGLAAAALEIWKGGEEERGRAGRLLGRRGQSLVLWGTWLVTQVVFFSLAGFFHAYYLVMLSPAIAALSGIGMAALWRGFRRGGWRIVLLPLALAGTAAVQVDLLSPYPDWNRWLTPLILGTVLAAVTLLVCSRLPFRRATGVALGGAALGVAALLAAPATWAAYTMQHGTGGGLGQAGPSPQNSFGGQGRFGGFGGPGGFPGGAGPFGQGGTPPGGSPSSGPGAGFGAGGSPLGGSPPGGPGAGGPGLGGPDSGFPLGGAGDRRDRTRGVFGGNRGAQVNRQLLSYLERHQGTAKYLVAVESSMTADPYIITTGKAVMALGGFNGSDKILSVTRLAQLVKAGTVRYFLLSGVDRSLAGSSTPPSRQATTGTQAESRRGFFGGGPGFGGPGGNVNAALLTWVGQHCAVVPASAYGSVQGSFTFGGPGGFGGTQLYDCAAMLSPSSQTR